MPDHVLRDSLTIFSQTKNLKLVRDFVTRLVQVSPVDAGDHRKIILAVDEAVANIIQHGYETDENGVIEVIVEVDNDRFAVVIRDSGVTFDPSGIRDPDIEEHFARGRKHGLGVFLMRKIMDEVEYSFKEGVRNELRLVKFAPKARAGEPA